MKLRDYLKANREEACMCGRQVLHPFLLCADKDYDLAVQYVLDLVANRDAFIDRLYGLSESQLQLLRRGAEGKIKVPDEQWVDAMVLMKNLLAHINDDSRRMFVFEEVKDMFHQVDDEEFRLVHEKTDWLLSCIRYACAVYGVFPVEVLYELYELKMHGDSMEEMERLVHRIPQDVTKCSVKHGLLASKRFRDPVACFRKQADVAFYIPDRKEIEVFNERGYPASTPAYRELRAAFFKRKSCTHAMAEMQIQLVYAMFMDGQPPEDWFTDLPEEEMNGRRGKRLLSLLRNAEKHTRRPKYRGHTEAEMT